MCLIGYIENYEIPTMYNVGLNMIQKLLFLNVDVRLVSYCN